MLRGAGGTRRGTRDAGSGWEGWSAHVVAHGGRVEVEARRDLLHALRAEAALRVQVRRAARAPCG